MDVMDDGDFARFGFEMRLEWISYIATSPGAIVWLTIRDLLTHICVLQRAIFAIGCG